MNPKTLYKLSYGLYLVNSKSRDSFNGQVANTVFQITSEPATIAISINRQNLTWEYINESKVFSVSVLNQDTPLPFIAGFGFRSGRDVDKLAGVQFTMSQSGVPIVVDNTSAWMLAQVIETLHLNTHTLYVGKVVSAEILSEKPVMTYDYFRQVKRGITPKTAPSYVEQQKEEKTSMSKYKCTICGWIYNPETGDPDGGIAAGTPFEEIPDNWHCPICGAGKGDFEKIS